MVRASVAGCTVGNPGVFMCCSSQFLYVHIYIYIHMYVCICMYIYIYIFCLFIYIAPLSSWSVRYSDVGFQEGPRLKVGGYREGWRKTSYSIVLYCKPTWVRRTLPPRVAHPRTRRGLSALSANHQCGRPAQRSVMSASPRRKQRRVSDRRRSPVGPSPFEQGQSPFVSDQDLQPQNSRSRRNACGNPAAGTWTGRVANWGEGPHSDRGFGELRRFPATTPPPPHPPQLPGLNGFNGCLQQVRSA